MAMGFDQGLTTHHFLLFNDGGAIEVSVNDLADAKNRDAIRSHLPHIAMMFGEGNFDAPMLVHDSKNAPGAKVMTERKEVAVHRRATHFEPLSSRATSGSDRRMVGSFTSRIAVDLNSRMTYAESLCEHRTRVPQQEVVSVISRTCDMGRHGDEPAADCPDVEIVDIRDVRQAQERRAHIINVEMPRCTLHQHGHGLLDQRPRGIDHKASDQDRRNRIDPIPTESPD